MRPLQGKNTFFQINPHTYFIDQNEGCKKHCYPKHPWHTTVEFTST